MQKFQILDKKKKKEKTCMQMKMRASDPTIELNIVWLSKRARNWKLGEKKVTNNEVLLEWKVPNQA